MPIQSPLRRNTDPLPEELPDGISQIAGEASQIIANDPELRTKLTNQTNALIGAENLVAHLQGEFAHRINEDVTLAVRATVRELMNHPDVKAAYYTTLGQSMVAALESI